MGKLAQACEDLAEGRRADQAWQRLIGDPASGVPSLIFTECPIAIQNGKLSELELSFKLLATNEAGEEATKQHQQLLTLETGASRLETIRQAVACAYLAICTTQPLAHNAIDEVTKWAPRAMGLVDGVSSDDLKLSMMETTDTIITRALDAIDNDAKEKRCFAHSATRWFAGITQSPAYELTIPILLFDSRDNSGTVAELHLKRFDSGTGRLYASPHTKLQLETHADTRTGLDNAWEAVQHQLGRSDVDVEWDLSGANSISGRSAEAAFHIGLKLLLTGAPYNRQCLVSAMVNEDRKLNHVGGINENGNPKLQAASTLVRGRSDVTVITSQANRLSAPEEAMWKAKGVTLTTCGCVDDALQIVSRQLALLDELLRSQIDLICRQAEKRFDRPVESLDDFNRYVIPMRVAQGLRPDVEDVDDDSIELSQTEDADSEGNEETERQVVPWDEFRAQCTGHSIVLGDPGFGKTTLFWHVIAESCRQTREQLWAGTPISEIDLAFYLPASQLPEIDPNRTVADGLVSAINAYGGLDEDIQSFVADKVVAGQCLLCVDALDEVSDSRVAEQFLTRIGKDHPGVQLLLSSRLTGFSRPPIEIVDENQVELMPFTLDQMRATVETWFDDPELTEDVWKTVSDGRLSDVLRSPILLNLARGQVADCVSAGKPIPTWQRRTELYDDFVQLGLRQHRDRTSKLFEEMELDEFPFLLQELALALWQEDAKQTIVSRTRLRQHMKQIIKDRDLWGMKDRFPRLLADLQDCGVLVPVTVNDEDPRMMFLHRTIGEYLAGQCLARRIEDGDAEAWLVIEKQCWVPAWKQIILFCAGTLQDAGPLLLKLKQDKCTVDNPLGDDLLRHRLLLAAQCLPEFASYDESIKQDITDQVMQSSRMGFGVLTDEAVGALRALIAVGAKYRDDPIQVRLRIETSTACLSPAAYSHEFFDFLLEKLWDACESDDRRMIKTKRPPAPFARALVAICDTIDVDQLRRSADRPADQYWRVVGAVFREASHEKSKHVELNAEFLRHLSACWFDTSIQKPTLGLTQAVAHMPEVSESVLRESSILIECSRVLADATAGDLHQRALALITSLGDIACRDNALVSSIAQLKFTAPTRVVADVMEALRPSLANSCFIDELVSSIEASDGARRRTGIEMLVSLRATRCEQWHRALEILLSNADCKRTFVRHFAEHSSLELVKTVNRLLRSGHRPVGLQAVEALVNSTAKSEFSGPPMGRLECLDNLMPAVVCEHGLTVFHTPETLEAISSSKELGVRLLLPALLGMACIHRPTTQLVDWGISKITDVDISAEDRATIAGAMTRMSPGFVRYLREQVVRTGLESKFDDQLSLATAICDDPDKAVALIRNSEGDWESKMDAIANLDLRSVSDPDLIELVLSRLHERSRRKIQIVSCALESIAPEGITRVAADRIVQAMCGRHSREFVTSAAGLVRENPAVFSEPLSTAYQDPDNPGHDDLGEVLPALGNFLVERPLFDTVESEAVSNDRRIAARARRLLARALNYCDPGHRERILLVAGGSVGATSNIGLFNHAEVKGELVAWLVEQLNHEDPVIVKLAARMLVDRERSARHWKERRSLISTFTSLLPSRFPLSMQPDSEGVFQSLARASVGCFRFFRQNDGSGLATKVDEATN